MKILHLFKDYFPPIHGGIEQHIHDLVHSLEGFRSAVLTCSRSPRRTTEDDDGVEVTRVAEFGRIASTPIAPGLIGELRGCPADILHVHLPYPTAELAVLATHPDGAIVASYHARNPRSGTTAAGTMVRRALGPLYEPVQQRFLTRCSRIVVGSEPMRDSPALRAHRDRTVVIPYGVDVQRWSRRPRNMDEVRRLGQPVVLFLGRLVHYKGLDVLVRAAADIDATVVIAGDGPMRQPTERLAEAYGLPVRDRSEMGDGESRKRVVFWGTVSDEDRTKLYHAADVFVLPSTSEAETFGIAMVEAMGSGTPIVSTEVGTGTSWVNLHGRTGLVVPPRDHRALARAVTDLLEDPVRRREMGSMAQDRARQHFTRTQMLTAIAKLYTDVGHDEGRPGL